MCAQVWHCTRAVGLCTRAGVRPGAVRVREHINFNIHIYIYIYTYIYIHIYIYIYTCVHAGCGPRVRAGGRGGRRGRCTCVRARADGVCTVVRARESWGGAVRTVRAGGRGVGVGLGWGGVGWGGVRGGGGGNQ